MNSQSRRFVVHNTINHWISPPNVRVHWSLYCSQVTIPRTITSTIARRWNFWSIVNLKWVDASAFFSFLSLSSGTRNRYIYQLSTTPQPRITSSTSLFSKHSSLDHWSYHSQFLSHERISVILQYFSFPYSIQQQFMNVQPAYLHQNTHALDFLLEPDFSQILRSLGYWIVHAISLHQILSIRNCKR